ncbi:MAG: MBL fold metallo-hydrolase [Proteobacteria bacterium]|nr:MBL fold metallo-hydrolase [Pseudomonadota bacterium]MBU1740196.1 MBL fold metallo-hydrolase [Pseudomonadota bacterium]
MEEKNFGPVRFIPGVNQGRYPCCHSVYIEGAGVLIDPASDRDRLKRLRDEEGVGAVWLSHWHEDHIAHLDLFEDLPLLMAAADAPPLADLETFLDWYDMDHDQYRDTWREIMLKNFHFRPRRPSGFLEDGQVRDLGGVTVEVKAAPGHTPGSLAFLFREPGVLCLADYDLTPFGPWYGDRYSSIDDTIASAKRLRQIPAKVWLTGHETGVFEQNPGELWDKYLAVIDTRQEKLEDFLAEPRTMEEISEAWIVYGRPREPKDFYWFAEKAIIKKHLQRLDEQGRLARDGERFALQ